MPKKASSKRNTHTFKKTTASKKKILSSNNSIKNVIHNDQDRSTRNHAFESEFPEHEGSESEGSESEDYTSFNNSRTSKGTHLHSRYSRSQSPIHLHSRYSLSRSPRHSQRSRSRSQQHSRSRSNSRKSLSYNSDYEAAAYVAERQNLLKVANQMAQHEGLTKSDNKESTDVLTQQETMTFQAYLKCLFFRTRHLTKAIIHKCIRLCFPSRKFSHKDISALKTAANAAYRSYRDALRNGLKKVQNVSLRILKSLSQVIQSDVQAYFQEDVWQSFLNHFFEVIDEEATFMTEFKEAWRTFMSKCLLKMIEEILDDEKGLVKIQI
ncbi:hypothetical protein F8M41_012004 [Gigaspora margarita]|uniref:Uncharacterized protein n=1 Tax=Gigaspora margarita TaxID=4874 RepID=A0A8H4EPQ6_GIGMA|nr:hypothetical protein F8M41_012004 [Gigaspora margarita]